ncbi:MAG: DUF5817 domain-containing protein [Halobacteriaceae archaeon]
MYAVVGCSSCAALWVVETDVETTGCPRCGTRHRFDRLKQFVTTEDAEAARQARTTMLADRADADDVPTDIAAADVETPVVDDAEYLAGSGIDPASVPTDDAAGEPTDRRAIVTAAVRTVDEATEAAIVEYATDRGVDAEAARTVLGRLVREGEATERDGVYRLL